MLADLKEEVSGAADGIREAGGSVAHCTVDVSDSASCLSMVEAVMHHHLRCLDIDKLVDTLKA